MSRGISSSVNKSNAAQQLRDEINLYRNKVIELKPDHGSILKHQRDFIDFAVTKNVLKFGSFTLKSGRKSPYFFNAGLFDNGLCMAELGAFYAQAIHSSGIKFDVIFGPAYKGIPLAPAVSMSWYHLYGESKDITYNRKEAKDHGEV